MQLQDQSVDMVFSNAVFEHINNPQESIKELSRITKS
ncbi:MAG: methyltransferase domain-containing protein [Patescibacteria group bacterium]